MQAEVPEDKTYLLLGEINQNSPSQGLPRNDVVSDDLRIMEALTATYITTMYFSAFTNLHIQSILSKDGEEMPRLQIAFARSYADYSTASEWLRKNGGEFINMSMAKRYYDELIKLSDNAILSPDEFYLPGTAS